MKPKSQTFSFFIELIVVIFFFTISATICSSFIVEARNKQRQATEIKNGLIEAQNMIEVMQANPNQTADQLFDIEKIDENTYQKGNLFITFESGDIIKGEITLLDHDDYQNILIELPFVIGGNHNE